MSRAAALTARASSLTTAFADQGAAWDLPPSTAKRLVQSLAAAERRKPAPSLPAQTKWARNALQPILTEFCDSAVVGEWSPEELATAAYALHCSAGNPVRVVPLLNDDVQAYTEMVTATIASLPRVASESVPGNGGRDVPLLAVC